MDIGQWVREQLDFKLAPWQLEIAKRFAAGEQIVVVDGHQSGRAAMRRMIAVWERVNPA